MHRDQKRVRDALLPQIMDIVTADTYDAKRDCTILNRALLQGPDPLYLAETCPDDFEHLCAHLGVDPAVGLDDIARAHVDGPGALLDGRGIPLDAKPEGTFLPTKLRGEALWIILASMSDCTEQEYGPHTTIRERLSRCQDAATRLSFRVAEWDGGNESAAEAFRLLTEMVASTTFTFDERGLPHAAVDHAFFVAYKLGHRACAVRAGDKVFWGTVPETTLDEQGLAVDVRISPSFGFVRDGSGAPPSA